MVRWSGLIFDEAHYLKNRDARRSRIARSLVDGAARRGDPFVYALTGTPLTNRPRDLFPLLQIAGHPLGKSFLSFARRYCAAYQNEYGWVTDGASNLEELAIQLRGVMLRRNKHEVLSLPPKIRTWVPLEVGEGIAAQETREVVRILLRNRLGQAGGARTDSGRAANGQIADRARLLAHLTTVRRKLAAAKATQTLEFVRSAVEQGEKVLLFSCFEEPLKRFGTALGEGCLLLTGSTPTARRQEIADRFQSPDGPPVLAANIVAGGVGLNLTAARQVVFNDLDWTPANHHQAEDRAYRIGQSGSVNVSYMVAAGTVDDFVATLLRTKSLLFDAVIEGDALSPELGGDLLQDLQRILAQLSPGLADLTPDQVDDEVIDRLLREAAAAAEAASPPQTLSTGGTPSGVAAVGREALLALARALAGPEPRKYRVPSSRNPRQAYTLTASQAGDVTCSCPGFDYRGQCRHARDLKAALVSGASLPAGCEAA